MSRISKALQKAGYSVQDFPKQMLGISYPAFSYRLRHGRLHLSDYHMILSVTGCKFEDLFPVPPVVINEAPKRAEPPQKKKDARPQEPPVLASAPSFSLVDVYDGSLPADL